MDKNTKVNLQLNVSDINIDSNTLQAQTILNVKVDPEPRSFELFIKLVGLFSYSSEYKREEVQQYLQHGSISVLLPYARELVTSLCTRLQIPIVMLPLIQLADPSDVDMNDELPLNN
jgi:preprotein translocase subunit SecB